MDPLKFRQRRLFRPAALEFFVGAFGDSGKPELLAARCTGLTRLAVTALALMLIVWGFAGSLPLRIAVTGKIVTLDNAKLYFIGGTTQQHTIRSGQEARIAPGTAQTKMLRGQVEKVTSTNEVAIALAPDATNAYRVHPGQATAWVTVGRQTPVQFLLGRKTW